MEKLLSFFLLLARAIIAVLAIVLGFIILARFFVFDDQTWRETILKKVFITSPAPVQKNYRYVLSRDMVVYELPGGKRAWAQARLQQNATVEYLGETHQFQDGKVWMRIRYLYGPAANSQMITGWVEASRLSE